MRFSYRFVLVFFIDSIETSFDYFGVTVMQWLTAATNAAARTSHDFDCLEVTFAVTNHFEKLAGIAQTVSDTYFNWCTVKVESCLTYIFEATEFVEINLVKFFACK